jgi:uncharacterized repeat protein (TIGR02543 family)
MKYFLKSAALAAVLALGLLAFAGCSSSGGDDNPESVTYTVAFDGDGATTAPKPATKAVIPPATTVGTLPSDPAKTGFVFGGWWTKKNGAGTAFTAATPVTANSTVYAKWTAVTPPPANPGTYTITFDGDGSTTAPDPATKSVIPPATTIDALPSDPAKTGFVFGGWWTEKNGAGTAFTAATPVTANSTVYAKWTAVTPPPATPGTYTVTFDGDDATTAPDSATKAVISPATTIDALPSDPAKTGFVFGGWWTEKNGAGTAFTAATPVTANITVYAKWTAVTPPTPPTCVIKFNANGGTGTMANQTMNVASPVALTTNSFGRYKHDFLGWATSETGAVAYADGTTPTIQAGTLELFAVWLSHCEPESNIAYTVIGGNAVISSINTTSTNVVLPDTLGGYPVTSFGTGTTGLFENNTTVQSVTIPPSMTTIPENTFKNSSVSSVSIPDTVKTIGKDAFYRCQYLASVDIPDSVTTIGTRAFAGCISLPSIIIPDSVTLIGTNAFDCCSNLAYVSLPNTITTIPHSMFYGCAKLTSITLPESLRSIDGWAFAVSGLEEIVIPDSVSTIGDWAFSGCNQLREITLSRSLSAASGDFTFAAGSSFTTIYMRSPTPPTFKMRFPTSVTKIMVPASANHAIRDAYRAEPACSNYKDKIFDE